MRKRGFFAWLGLGPASVVEAQPTPETAPVALRPANDAAVEGPEWLAAAHEAWSRSTFLYRACDDDGSLIWPDDPDEVPLWRVERELWAELTGYRWPGYRTKREAEQADWLVAMGLQSTFTPRVLTTLSPTAAAMRFLDGLRHPTEVREIPTGELADLYVEHCEAEGLEPLAIDTIRRVLPDLPGVYKRLTNEHRGGRRHRPTVWTIVPACEVELEPMRLAA